MTDLSDETNAPLEIRRATCKPSALRLPPPLPAPADSLAVLLQDRGEVIGA